MAAFVDSSCDFVDDYSYDSLGRVISVVEYGVSGGDAVANKEIDLTYNSDGELATVDRYEDGVLAVEGDYTYDSAGELVGLVYRQGDTVLASYAWTYSGGVATLSAGSSNADWLPSGGTVPVHDTTGVTSALMSGGYAGLDEVTSCTSVDGTASYSYDPTGQLASATYSGGQADESYTYDANGNRVTANGDTYATGADNELLSDGTYTYAYDGEGNRTAKFIDANHDGVLDAGDTTVTEYTWDNRERLVEVKDYATEGGSPTEVVDYLYDVEDRWIGENIFTGGSEHQIRFAYDGDQIVLQFDKDGSGTLDASNLSQRYTWLPNAVDQLMSDEQTDKVVWTLGDNQGTIRDLAVMDSGVTSVVNHRVFDSYGNLVSQTNSAVDCLFGYTGLPFDKASGTYRSATRPYDPVTGRWDQPDVIQFKGGDTNLYRYCGNSPTNATDQTGSYPTDPNNSWTPFQFFGIRGWWNNLPYLTGWGCGGLAAWRAGAPISPLWGKYYPTDIMKIKGATEYQSWNAVQKALNALGGKGVIIAVQSNFKDWQKYPGPSNFATYFGTYWEYCNHGDIVPGRLIYHSPKLPAGYTYTIYILVPLP